MNNFIRLLSPLLMMISLGTTAAVPPSPDAPKADTRPAPLVDHDQNGISDGLQARLAEAGPSDRFNVVITFNGPGDAASARAQVGNFELRREFKIVRGFAATMTAGQIKALATRSGVFRIEEDFEVTVKLNTARTDFGANDAVQSLGYNGTGVKVCVVDTGVDSRHEQLDDQLIPFYDVVKGQSVAYDDHGHGTHVAGICCGKGTGGGSAGTYRGVAPGVNLYAAKVLDSGGSGSDSQVIAGIEWCVTQAVDVISISIGGGPSDGNDGMSQAVNAAVDAGVAVVAAAGNSGDGPESVTTPGAASKAITVGAAADTGSNGIHLTPWSSRGPNLAIPAITKPDIVAPGDAVTSAQSGTVSGYVSMSGTSMATPFVAGSVALARQADFRLTPAQLKQKLGETAQDRGVDGQDNDWGWGLLDVYAFVQSAGGNLTPDPWKFPGHQYISGTVPNSGIWSYPFEVTDLTTPIAATVNVDGVSTQTCLIPWPLGGCFLYSESWTPDLEARIKAPDGSTLGESLCPGIPGPAGCGQYGRQETPRVMPTKAGTYTLEVVPASATDGGDGMGGKFTVELSKGPIGFPPPPPPSLTVTVNQAAGQSDPANSAPISFAVVFSEPVSDFATGDVMLGGTAGATTAAVTGSGANYNVAVSGMTGDGTVIASIAAGAAHNSTGIGNVASTSTDNTVSYAAVSVAPPLPPTELIAGATSRAQVNLAWKDNANNETGFEIQRCTGKNCNNFTLLSRVDTANTISYQDSTVVPNTNYGYRVRAYNGSGQSAFSNIQRVKTPR